jgi:hypothetical protein
VNDEFYLDGSGHGIILGNIPVFATNTMKKLGLQFSSPRFEPGTFQCEEHR